MILRGRSALLPIATGGGGLIYGFSSTFFLLFSLMLFLSSTLAAPPRFFESNRMAALYLPTETEVDSIIYRLRADDPDRDYPLIFSVKELIGQNLIYLDNHPCTPSNDVLCEADVYLRMPVEAGRVYSFNLSVSDRRGFQTQVPARVYSTEGRATPISEVFLKYSPTVTIKEDIPPKAIISMMTVRKRQRASFGEFQVLGPARKMFRMTPGNLVSKESINGTLILEQKVDFEKANLHTFKVCLLPPYSVELSIDTRNIACVVISVVVEDVQDEPPVFTKAPPVTRVPATAVHGDHVVQIEAKDGDRGIPRAIRYSILPASSLYTQYFKMNPMTGMISMNETALKLREKMISLEPILMTVTAEEVTNSIEYRALSSSVEIAFVVLDAEFLIPKFVHETYVGEVYEDSLPETEVTVNSPFLEPGVKGLFALELQGDNGAFSVQPGVVTDSGEIKIKVKNSFLVDYEKSPQINFRMVARQMASSRQTTGTTEITVKILDANDNAPEFSQAQYEVSIYENVTRGTSIIRVHAVDEDSGQYGVVRYTNLYGDMSEMLYLEPTTGLITCATDNHGFDREKTAELILTVEAKDNNGRGASANTATAKIIIRLKDINDSPPRFVDSIYKGVMAPDRQRLKDAIIFRAVDADAERPNNEVVYEIVRSSYSDYFYVDRNSGRFDVNPNFFPRTRPLSSEGHIRSRRQIRANDTVISLTVKATDLGNPPLSDFVDVKIFRQEYGERVIRFIYPKDDLYVRRNKKELESILNSLTGGSTEILDSKPLQSSVFGKNTDFSKSEVIALVRFNMNTIIDVESVLTRLNSTQVQILRNESQQRATAITELKDSKNSYIVGVVILCILLALLILVILACFCIEGCPLYRSSKIAAEEGEEGVSYVRVEDTSRYRGVNNEDISDTPGWWQSLPLCMKDILLFCGYIPPGRKSRVAWSGDERQRFGRIQQQPEHHGLQNRNPLMQEMHRHQQHHSLRLEDIDGTRGTMGGLVGAPGAVMQDPNAPQDLRRVYVLKDAMGIPRVADSLQEGATYLLEDVDGQPQGGVVNPNEVYNQGNSEVLRQQAISRDAAFYTDDQRRLRRADMVSEGTGYIQEDQRGSQRYVNGQAMVHNGSYGQSSYAINNSKGRGRGNRDEDYTGGLTDRSSKEKGKGKRNMTTEASQIDRSTDPLDRNTKSARSSNIPGTYGYQHTKTSILRYETNKSKIEEEREALIRQGKDPDEHCISHQGGGYIIAAESRKGSMREKEGKSVGKSHGRRSQNQFSMPGDRLLERSGSLTDIETNLEKEAARRNQLRRNSAGMNDDASAMAENRDVVYGTENERTDEIERRIQQRRTEASKALSGELYSQNRDNQNLQPHNIQPQIHNPPQNQQIQLQQQPQSQQGLQLYQQSQLQPQNQQSLQLHQQPQISQNQQTSQPYQQPQLSMQLQPPVNQQPQPPPQQQIYFPQQSHSPAHFQQTAQPHNTQSQQSFFSPPLQTQHQQSQDTRAVEGSRADNSPNQFSEPLIHNQQPNPALPPTQPNFTPQQSAPSHETNFNNFNPPTSVNPTAVYPENASVNTKYPPRESVETAIASALVDMAVNNENRVSNPPQSMKPNPLQLQKTNPGENQLASNIPAGTTSLSQDHNLNLSNINIKNLMAKPSEINPNLNSEPVDSEIKDDTLRMIEDEINLETTKSNTIIEKNAKNDASILNIPKERKKRHKLLEKKSIFTIAYDGMKTDQLRPESADSSR